jgi:hypothetical protein
MNILIVSGAFAPQISPRSFRTTELVRELCAQGHQVTLYIPDTGDDRTELAKQYGFTLKYYNRPKDRYSSSKNKLIFCFGRFLVYYCAYPMCLLLKYLRKELEKEKGQYDLLISIAAPHAIHWTIGLMYAKGHRLAKRWVADCGDPFMLSGTSNHWHPFYLRQFEKRWCRLCDYITVPTPGAVNGYYPEFRDKIRVLPQAFNFDEIIRDEYHPHSVPTFAYSGSIWKGSKDPRLFLDYLCDLQADFRFYVYTNDLAAVQPYRKRLGEKLIVSSYIPRLELLRKLSTMDFLVHFEFQTSVQTPSKLIDYALSGRPILPINVQNMDHGLIDEFLHGDYTRQHRVENLEQYDIHNVARKFLELAEL